MCFLQVLQTQPPALLELPLSLLCYLCLSSPQGAVPCFTKAAQASGFLPQSAEAEQILNHLNQSGSKAEQPRHNGIQHKNMFDLSGSEGDCHPKRDTVRGSMDKSRGTRDPLKVQSQLCKSKSVSGRLRERNPPEIKRDQKILSVEHLQASIHQHCGVEELLDSLELHEGFSHLIHLPTHHKSSMSWLIDSLEQPRTSLGHFRGNRDCPSVSEAKGQSLDPQVRTASSLLSVLLQSESFCGCATHLLTLLSQTTCFPTASALPVDPALLRQALDHRDDGVRTAACYLLAQLKPDLGSGTTASTNWITEPVLFQELLSHLADPAPTVRRIACKAVEKWLSQIGQTEFKGLSDRSPHLQEGPKTKRRTVKGRGKKVVEVERVRQQGGMGDSGFASRPMSTYVEGEEWVKVAIGAACPAVSLLSDSDAVVRRSACVILGTMAVVGGGDRALISADAPRHLLRVARGDSHHAVQRQAMTTLHAFGQLDTLRQVRVVQLSGFPSYLFYIFYYS